MAKRKKKRRGRGKYVAGGACIVAAIGIAIGLNFDGLGFGDGWGFSTSGSSSEESDYSVNDDNGANGAIDNDYNEQDENNDENAPTQLVTVEGDSILHDGAEISLEQLATLLTNYSDATWELRSERAIAAVHDDVRALLQEHGVSFTETTD